MKNKKSPPQHCTLAGFLKLIAGLFSLYSHFAMRMPKRYGIFYRFSSKGFIVGNNINAKKAVKTGTFCPSILTLRIKHAP
jgi:hypothetical protein